MNETRGDISAGAVSIRDKVDYRKEIHKLIDMCLMSYSNPEVCMPNIKKFVACVCNDYPGIDLKTPIEEEMDLLQEEYDKELNVAKQDGEIWYHPLKHNMLEYDLAVKYWYSLFNFMMNLLGSKRVLMWGKKIKHGGTPSPDKDSEPFEGYEVKDVERE